MRNNELSIILNYLKIAYKKLRQEKEINQQGNSERFPMMSQERIAAEHEFDVLSSLARDLGIPNPWAETAVDDTVVED